MDLTTLGWNQHWQDLFTDHAAAGFAPARVVTEDKHYYTVVSDQGPHLAQIVGRLLHLRADNAQLPKVGDWVAIRRPEKTDRVSIEAVLPRKSTLDRKIAGRAGSGQVLAANIDVALVVQALDETLNLRRIERFLVMVHEGGSRPVVVLNKTDLCDDIEARLAEVQAVAGHHLVLAVSARTGRALPRLRELLVPGTTAVVLGTSGVGKSTLINRIYGERVQPTIPVREWDSKGRHTTTARELILLPAGGLIIDTPGLREFHLWLADGGLDDAFPDIAEIATRCRFRDCRHHSEGGCAVQQAVTDGSLPKARIESYQKLQTELDGVAERRQQHTWAVNRRKVRGGTKAYLLDTTRDDEE
jgi:ribosome biogenesis GTPase